MTVCLVCTLAVHVQCVCVCVCVICGKLCGCVHVHTQLHVHVWCVHTVQLTCVPDMCNTYLYQAQHRRASSLSWGGSPTSLTHNTCSTCHEEIQLKGSILTEQETLMHWL